jgi:hypothetical protein
MFKVEMFSYGDSVCWQIVHVATDRRVFPKVSFADLAMAQSEEVVRNIAAKLEAALHGLIDDDGHHDPEVPGIARAVVREVWIGLFEG